MDCVVSHGVSLNSCSIEVFPLRALEFGLHFGYASHILLSVASMSLFLYHNSLYLYTGIPDIIVLQDSSFIVSEYVEY